MDYSPPGSSVYGIFQARILEWVGISFSSGSSWPRDQTQVSRITDRCFTIWATRESLREDSRTWSKCKLLLWMRSEAGGGFWAKKWLDLLYCFKGQWCLHKGQGEKQGWLLAYGLLLLTHGFQNLRHPECLFFLLLRRGLEATRNMKTARCSSSPGPTGCSRCSWDDEQS